jgi:Fe-S-cluster containining protein
MDVEATEINGEALCPCGSEKPYGDCCARKGRTFALLEFEGKRIFFDVDQTEDSVERLVRFCSENILKMFREKRAAIDKEKALRDLKTIYEMTDEALKPFVRGSSCEKGCNACCYLIVDSAALEAEMVCRYVATHFSDEDRSRVLKRIKQEKRHYPDPVSVDEEFPESLVEKHFSLNIPCPFLSLEGLCTIYDVRPINCRKHLVFSDPSQCRNMAATASYEAEYFLEVDPALNGLSTLVYPKFNYNRHFPDWFTEEFDLS